MKPNQVTLTDATAKALVQRAYMGKSKRDGDKATLHFQRPAAQAIAALFCSPAEALQMSQKAAMRTAEACDFAVSGDLGACDAVTAAMVALIVLNKRDAATFNDAHVFAGWAKPAGESVQGESLSRSAYVSALDDAAKREAAAKQATARFLTTTNAGTISSKVSRTVGENGLFTRMGITSKGDKHGFSIDDREHPFIVAYATALAKMTAETFDLLKQREEEKARAAAAKRASK